MVNITKDLVVDNLSIINSIQIPYGSNFNTINQPANLTIDKNVLYGRDNTRWTPLSTSSCRCHFEPNDVYDIKYYDVCTESTDYSVAILPQNQGSFSFNLNVDRDTRNGMYFVFDASSNINFLSNNNFYITHLGNRSRTDDIVQNNYLFIENVNRIHSCRSNTLTNIINCNFEDIIRCIQNEQLNIIHSDSSDYISNKNVNIISSSNVDKILIVPINVSSINTNESINVIGTLFSELNRNKFTNDINNLSITNLDNTYVNTINSTAISRSIIQNNIHMNNINQFSISDEYTIKNNRSITMINYGVQGNDTTLIENNVEIVLKNVDTGLESQITNNLNCIHTNSTSFGSFISIRNNTNVIDINNYYNQNNISNNSLPPTIESNLNCIFINNQRISYTNNTDTIIVGTFNLNLNDTNRSVVTNSGDGTVSNINQSIIIGNSFTTHENHNRFLSLNTMKPIIDDDPVDTNGHRITNMEHSILFYTDIPNTIQEYTNLTNFCGSLYKNNILRKHDYITSFHSQNIEIDHPWITCLNLLNNEFNATSQKEHSTLTNNIELNKNIRHGITNLEAINSPLNIRKDMNVILINCISINQDIEVRLPTSQNQGQYIKLMIYNIPQGSNYNILLTSTIPIYNTGILTNGITFNSIPLNNGTYELFFYENWFIFF